MAPGGGVMVLHGGGTMFSSPFVSCWSFARLQLELGLPGGLICGVGVGVFVGVGVCE